MRSHSLLARPATASLAPYVATNGATVATLYLAQALVTPATAEFGPSTAILLMPGATLAGYAIGVGLSAAVARDLTARRGLALHLFLLTSSLCLGAWAWTPALGAIACLLIGSGCSLTQRLLASATSAVPAARRAQVIGWIIAGGLCGIVVARAGVPAAADVVGRRTLLLADACLIALLGCACLRATERVPPGLSAAPDRVEPAWTLYHRFGSLRHAALHQTSAFAAYNLGWALYPRILAAEGANAAVPMGVVAALGTVAALVSGRLYQRHDPANIARSGGMAILFAGALALVAGRLPHGADAAMAMLDIGTQIALVANQARAQSCAADPATRGRMAAIVTTLGFLGGAIGAAIGNLWR